MPTVFTHAIVGIAVGKALGPKQKPRCFWCLLAACAMLPDADVLAFLLGIPYDHPLGHRGFFHSLSFSFLAGGLLAMVFFYKAGLGSLRWWHLALCLSLAMATHGLLDMLTNGGLGVALFAPFNDTRYFFDWRPVVVSPIGISGIFSAKGLRILESELLWICLPTLLLLGLLKVLVFLGKGRVKTAISKENK